MGIWTVRICQNCRKDVNLLSARTDKSRDGCSSSQRNCILVCDSRCRRRVTQRIHVCPTNNQMELEEGRRCKNVSMIEGKQATCEPSGHEFVSHTVYCQKVRRIRRIPLQLLSQLMDMVIHSSGSWMALVAPDFLEKLISRDDTELILNHKLQRLEFLRRKKNLLAATGHVHC